MSYPLSQTIVMIRANLLSLPRRAVTSVSMALSITLSAGHFFGTGTRDIVVGAQLARRLGLVYR